MIIGKGIPSPHGLRLIIGIHEGFLPFPVGDGLFKYTSDCFDHNYRESNPRLFLRQKHRLCYQCDGCIRTHPRDDRNVFAKAPVGRWFGTESVTREIVDATIIWQAHTLAQQSCHISLLHSPWIWSWHQFWPWSLVAITLTVAIGSVDNSLHPCPSRTTVDWEFSKNR